MDSEVIKDLLTNVTPGPWAWEESHPLNACASVTAKADAGWTIDIATLYGTSDNVPAPTMPDEPWGDHPIRRADARFIAAARELVPALLAERDAALAEVARLSTPPDDAEVAVLEGWLRNPWSKAAPGTERGPIPEWVYALMHQAADALARLSHAQAAERKLADDLEAELVLAEADLAEAEDKFHIASFYIKDEQTLQCVKDRVMWMAKAGRRIRDAITKHRGK